MITIVAVMCHLLGAVPVCHEVIVTKTDDAESSVVACARSQPALASWKENSIYSSEAWWIKRIKCVPGNYVVPNET